MSDNGTSILLVVSALTPYIAQACEALASHSGASFAIQILEHSPQQVQVIYQQTLLGLRYFIGAQQGLSAANAIQLTVFNQTLTEAKKTSLSDYAAFERLIFIPEAVSLDDEDTEIGFSEPQIELYEALSGAEIAIDEAFLLATFQPSAQPACDWPALASRIAEEALQIAPTPEALDWNSPIGIKLQSAIALKLWQMGPLGLSAEWLQTLHQQADENPLAQAVLAIYGYRLAGKISLPLQKQTASAPLASTCNRPFLMPQQQTPHRTRLIVALPETLPQWLQDEAEALQENQIELTLLCLKPDAVTLPFATILPLTDDLSAAFRDLQAGDLAMLWSGTVPISTSQLVAMRQHLETQPHRLSLSPYFPNHLPVGTQYIEALLNSSVQIVPMAFRYELWQQINTYFTVPLDWRDLYFLLMAWSRFSGLDQTLPLPHTVIPTEADMSQYWRHIVRLACIADLQEWTLSKASTVFQDQREQLRPIAAALQADLFMQLPPLTPEQVHQRSAYLKTCWLRVLQSQP